MASFLRYGIADGNVNEFEDFLGAGFRFLGLLPARADDELGIGLAYSSLGRGARRAARRDHLAREEAECALEFTWRAPIARWLTMQGDVQYIFDPGADPAIDDALVVGLRAELTWTTAKE